jgi:hypothetical protein
MDAPTKRVGICAANPVASTRPSYQRILRHHYVRFSCLSNGLVTQAAWIIGRRSRAKSKFEAKLMQDRQFGYAENSGAAIDPYEEVKFSGFARLARVGYKASYPNLPQVTIVGTFPSGTPRNGYI